VKTTEQSIEANILEVAARNGEDRYQWGHYIERNDGRDGKSDWFPIIYDGDEESVRQWHGTGRHGDSFRNSRIVRRAIGPWEQVSADVGRES